jgi:cell wall-associated NlpC family hydrolase
MTAAIVRVVPKIRVPSLIALLLCATSVCAQPADDPVLDLLKSRGLAPHAAIESVVAPMRTAAADLVMSAMNYLDTRYRRGGNSAEEGFDCSGFTRHVFDSVLGLQLPRRSAEQAQQAGLAPVARTELQPGDLVFFNTLKRTFSHVGIYIGDGKFIHSPRTGQQVRIESMQESYWARRFDGARRATGL